MWNVEQITQEALALPSAARLLLADQLVESLDQNYDEDENIRKLWVIEAKKRQDEITTGKVKTIPGDEALEHVRRTVSQ